ncbi:MAG: hypothetical protein IRZ16_08080 [Myxococcaceae bacterium]|nr:hypothetical protein [Myxococcaceae bacterium]
MARPRKNTLAGFPGALPANLSLWAESLGEALGRGVARGINDGLTGLTSALGSGVPQSTGRRGRPPKYPLVPVPPEKRCSVSGCPNPSRSRGLCSRHYQAARRDALQKKA